VQVYTDSHVSTRYHWARPHALSPESTATITWDIPEDTSSGKAPALYKFRALGLLGHLNAQLWQSELMPFAQQLLPRRLQNFSQDIFGQSLSHWLNMTCERRLGQEAVLAIGESQMLVSCLQPKCQADCTRDPA